MNLAIINISDICKHSVSVGVSYVGAKFDVSLKDDGLLVLLKSSTDATRKFSAKFGSTTHNLDLLKPVMFKKQPFIIQLSSG